jgi:hypothetical protein
LQLLEEHLDADDLPLLKQCENFRSLASKKERTKAATQALKQVGDAIEQSVAEILPIIAEEPPVETQEEPLAPQPTLASREFRFDFREQSWLVRIELADDPGEGDWLSLSDHEASDNGTDVVEIRVSMAHPFMIAFAQTDPDSIEPLLRVAAALPCRRSWRAAPASNRPAPSAGT